MVGTSAELIFGDCLDFLLVVKGSHPILIFDNLLFKRQIRPISLLSDPINICLTLLDELIVVVIQCLLVHFGFVE